MALPKINSVGGERLRGDAVVVIQSAAESTVTMNSSGLLALGFHRKDQSVPESLVISFGMIVREVFPNRSSQRVFTKEDRSFQAFFLDRTDEPFGIRI
jgi:hypothetical protein